MSLSRIILRLARNPGTQHSEPDDERGYTLVAPLTPDGHLDESGYERQRQDCTVRRFAPDEAAETGRLTRHGGQWTFRYAPEDTTEEPLFRLKDHRFRLGDYVSILDADGELLAYRVSEVTKIKTPTP